MEVSGLQFDGGAGDSGILGAYCGSENSCHPDPQKVETAAFMAQATARIAEPTEVAGRRWSGCVTSPTLIRLISPLVGQSGEGYVLSEIAPLRTVEPRGPSYLSEAGCSLLVGSK